MSKSEDKTKSLRILVVDDCFLLSQRIVKAFKKKGFVAESHGDAEKTLETLSVEEITSFDVILSDINMPNVDGYEFIRKLASESDKRPMVMFMTGAISNPLPDDLSEYVLLGKPFEIQQIIDLIVS